MTISHFALMDTIRWRIVFVLIAFAIVDSMVAIFAYSTNSSGTDLRTKITDTEVMITQGIAAIIGVIVAIRHGTDGLHGKTYTSLSIGLVLWFMGEITWTVYEAVLQVDMPSFSLADVFWILGYGFFGFHLFRMYIYFARVINKKAIAGTSIAVGIVIAYLIYQMAIVADFSSSDSILTFASRTSYAVGDAVLILPALLLLGTLRKAKLHFSPWFFISISLLTTAAADSIFSFVSLRYDGGNEWISNLLYDSANLCMAGGLYWYNRFVIMDTSKVEK